MPNYSSRFEVRTHHMHMKNFITFQCRKQSSTYAICRNLQQTFILALHFVYFSCLLPSKFSVSCCLLRVSTFKDENQSSGGLAISRKLLFVKLWQKINKLLFDVSAPMMFCFQKTLSSRLLNSFASQCVIIIYYPGKYRHAQ